VNVEDRLTIRIAGTGERVPIGSFLKVLHNALSILQDVHAAASGQTEGALDWQIADVRMGSPVYVTISAGNARRAEAPRQVIGAFLEGLRGLEERGDRIPAHFSERSLVWAKELVSVLNDDVAQISFIANGRPPVAPSQHLAANVDRLLPREHEELGTLVGRVETLSIHDKPAFAIWDVLTGARIECPIPPERMQAVHQLFGKRVAVSGRVRYARDGKPTKITVEQIRPLRDHDELIPVRELPRINITDGVDPSEYVRGIRDAH